VVTSEVPLSCTVDCEVKPVPVTVNVVSPLPASTVEGESELRVGAGLTTVTDAEPVRLGSTTLAAFTVTTFGEGGIAGAVYRPLASIMPIEELPPTKPFTDQVTAELPVPATVAVNWMVLCAMAVALRGETETKMAGVCGG